MKWSIGILLVLLASLAQAQMYQWVSPESGNTQLSGRPPAWYRSVDGGPRVLVFDKGKLVDDTAVPVSPGERLSLRAAAFRERHPVDTGKERDDERLKLASKLQEMLNSAYLDELFEEQETPAPDAETDPEQAEPNDIERLKAVIAEWERRRTEQAKRVIAEETDSDGDPIVPPPTPED